MTLLPLISTLSIYGIGQVITPSVANSVNWPTANKIFYVPFRIPEDCTVLRAFWNNGNAVAGNLNLGLYSATGTKLWETGSTGQSGTDQLQFVDITDQPVSAGLYYGALQNSGTSRIVRQAGTLYFLQAAGVLEEAAGSFTLPSTATFAKLSVAYVPVFGLDLRGAV
jgi:hypothetical protein